jgi:hypothetical protein
VHGSCEWIARRLVELTELIVEPIVRPHEASQVAHDLIEWHERIVALDGHELGHRMTVDGDTQALARLDAT